MSFLVPIMVLGGAAAMIPLIIHLRNRSRFQVVHWGAMHLLESVLRVNRRRIRLEQIILLLVRMAIPAAIALFMARPVLTGWRSLPGDVKRSVIVGVDNSYSMDAGGGAQSNFSKALRGADGILAALPRGSDAAMVPLAGGAAAGEKATVDLRGLRGRLAELAGGLGLARPAPALEAAMARFAEMAYADRELVILSDFQRTSWSGGSDDPRRLAAALAAAPMRPHITLMRYAPEPIENISVEALSMSRSTVGVGQKTRIRAVVRNHGRQPRSGLRVRLRVDGQDREVTEIAVAAGEQAQVMFAHAFEKAGSHYLEVSVEADGLMADNALVTALPVWDQIPVLLVNGEPSREPLRGETDYLEVALQPFSAGAVRLADLIRTRVVEPERLNAEGLRQARVVVLANVASLDAGQSEALEEFVRAGGGLLVFTGSRLDVGWFNAAWAASESGLFPLRLGPPAGSTTDPQQQTTLVGGRFEHEALTLFNLPENGTIGGAEIWRWHPPADREQYRTAGEAFTVLARLASGDPFLIERKLGAGRVMLCTSACDADWGNLPMRPAYVPFVQQLVTYLASAVYPPRNVEVGAELAAFLPAGRAGEELTLTLPDGSRKKLTAGARGARAVATWPSADRPGLYTLEGRELAPIHFAVNTPRDESDLAVLDDAQLAELAAALGADVVNSPSEYQSVQQRRRSGREVWPHVFGAALALLLIELFLEQRFARRAG